MLKSWNVTEGLLPHYFNNELYPVSSIICDQKLVAISYSILQDVPGVSAAASTRRRRGRMSLRQIWWQRCSECGLQKSSNLSRKCRKENDPCHTTPGVEDQPPPTFPAESWTFDDLKSVCAPCTYDSEASRFASEEIRLYNKKPSLVCARDTRTVFMCALYTAERLHQEVIRRFPRRRHIDCASEQGVEHADADAVCGCEFKQGDLQNHDTANGGRV